MLKTRPFRDLLLERLADPEVAAAYLTEAYAESPAMFRRALRNVAQSRQMASVARKAGVKRESLYRATSDDGNPTLDTLSSVLNVLDLGVEVYSRKARAGQSSTPPATYASGRRHAARSQRISADRNAAQYNLPFGESVAAQVAHTPGPVALAATASANSMSTNVNFVTPGPQQNQQPAVPPAWMITQFSVGVPSVARK